MPRKKKTRKWAQRAVKRPGAFSAKARRAGMSTHAYAEKERNAPGRLGKQARLALTFEKMAKRRKKGRQSSHRAR